MRCRATLIYGAATAGLPTDQPWSCSLSNAVSIPAIVPTLSQTELSHKINASLRTPHHHPRLAAELAAETAAKPACLNTLRLRTHQQPVSLFHLI